MSDARTADDWVAELDRRMDADPNVELAPVAVGIMRTTQIVHEAMRAEYLRGIEDAAKLFDKCRDVMLAVELIPSRIRGLALEPPKKCRRCGRALDEVLTTSPPKCPHCRSEVRP